MTAPDTRPETRAEAEWTPTLYDVIETRWDTDCYTARWKGDGLVSWVMAHGDSREEAVEILIEMTPDILAYLHAEADEALQALRKHRSTTDEPTGGEDED